MPSHLTPDYAQVANSLCVSRLAAEAIYKSRFVIVEGSDGSGKTLLTQGLTEALKQRYGAAEALRQPGGTPLGEILRKALKTPEEPVSPTARFFLMEASRALTVDMIQSRRAAGDQTWFVADRFHDSGFVYQGLEGVNQNVMDANSEIYRKGLLSTVTFYLKVSAETAFARLNSREGSGPRDAYDDSSVQQLEEIIRRYELRVMSRPGLFYILDGEQTPEKVLADAVRFFDNCKA